MKMEDKSFHCVLMEVEGLCSTILHGGHELLFMATFLINIFILYFSSNKMKHRVVCLTLEATCGVGPSPQWIMAVFLH